MVQTLKTAVVVVLLLSVCYGAYVTLNAPEPELPDSLSEFMSEDESLDDLIGIDMGDTMSSMEGAVSVDPAQLMNTLESAQPAASLDSASLGLPENVENPVDVPDSQQAAQPSFPALPTDMSDGKNPPSSMPNLVSEPGVNAFPPLDASPSNAPAANALVGNQREVAEPSSNPGDLIPEFLDASEDQSETTADSPPTETQTAQGNDQSSNPPAADFGTARAEALKLAEAGELKSALELLSPYFDSPELGYEQRSDLIDILDALSREVIYSDRHLLHPAYVVKPQDTVASVAEAHQINPELLRLINRLGDSKALVPGSQLKVVQGPFRAVVSLERSELTLFLNDLYAGRFPFSKGREPEPRAGSFAVVDRRQDRSYYTSGEVVRADDPRNPYGGYWLDLGEQLCIHGTAEMASSDLANAGCISLAPIDAKDIFNILAVDSRVEIRP